MPVDPEHRLTKPAELLFRQATQPGWVQDGRPTSQLFEPRPVDKGRVSVDREFVIGNAEKSLEQFRANGFSSMSTWAVSVGEVNTQQLEAYAAPTKKNKAHALIDMSLLSPEDQLVIATVLAALARKRGVLAPRVSSAAAELTAAAPILDGAADEQEKTRATSARGRSKVKASTKEH
jgi:hypothetical protein